MTARTPGPVFFGRGNWRRTSRGLRAQAVSQGPGGLPEGPRRVSWRLGRRVRRRPFRGAQGGFPKDPGGLPQDSGAGSGAVRFAGPRGASRRTQAGFPKTRAQGLSQGQAQALSRRSRGSPGPTGPRPGCGVGHGERGQVSGCGTLGCAFSRSGSNSRGAAARWSVPSPDRLARRRPDADMEAPGRWRRGMHQRPGF